MYRLLWREKEYETFEAHKIETWLFSFEIVQKLDCHPLLHVPEGQGNGFCLQIKNNSLVQVNKSEEKKCSIVWSEVIFHRRENFSNSYKEVKRLQKLK